MSEHVYSFIIYHFKMTSILETLLNCDLNKLKILLQGVQDVNDEIPGTEGCSPLHIAVGLENMHGREQVLSYLLAEGADPNARSYDDLTPVHIAAMWNNCYELEKLIQYGGNPWLTDNENKNAFDMAADNHAYEAFQLLNKYLAEDKLNLRPLRDAFKNPAENRNLKELSTSKRSQSASHITNTTFLTANDLFPLLMSSSEDETESFMLNISKFLKKDSIKKQKSKQVNLINRSDVNDCSSDRILSEVKKADFFPPSDIKNKSLALPYSRPDIKAKEYFIPFLDSNDSSKSINESEYNEDSSETILTTDNESNVVLVEKCSKFDPNLIKNDSIDGNTFNDWKSCQTSDSSTSIYSNCPSHSETSIVITDELRGYSNSKIFQELQNLGDRPGPVLNHTRDVYLRRLARLMSGCSFSCFLPEPKYFPEVYLFLECKLDLMRLQKMEKLMTEEFDNSCSDTKWREGNQRCCFNYFLLDPRVTQNLPLKAQNESFQKIFLMFLDSLFYVGKGTQGRPYSHLLQAAKKADDINMKSAKILHILDIWKAGLGVISLHCFNNSIPAEAYTREACIIEGVGLSNLTNEKRGNFYGQCSKWTKSRKRQIGIFLLQKALHILLIEGEKQIKPKNIRSIQ